MNDKHLIFLFASFVLVPIGIAIARNSRLALNLVFCALVFGTTQPEALFGLPTDINFMSREWYRGSTRGIEVSYLDLLALILLFASRPLHKRTRLARVSPPSSSIMWWFFGYALLTVVIASSPKLFGTFELTKILRGILVFYAVWYFLRSPEHIRLFIAVLVIIVFYEAALALYQRYVLGVHRVRASLPHPNSLSMYCLQIFPFVASVFFANDISSRMKALCVIASVLIAGVVILTISRTGFASLALLCFFLIILNVRGRWTPRNIGIMAAAVLLGLTMTVRAWDTLSSRYIYFDFQNEYLSEQGDRGSYFRQGWPAFLDNPIVGIGLNNWSYWISNRYAAEVGHQDDSYPSLDHPPYSSGQAAPAHNLFLLTAVELGLVGLALLLAVFGRWLYVSGVGFRKVEGDFVDRVRLGALLSLCGILLQSSTEWTYRQTSLFFFAHIAMAVAAHIYCHRQTPGRR